MAPKAKGKDGFEDMLAKFTGKSVRVGLLMAALSLALAACGVRGSLDAPPSATASGTARSAEASGTQQDSAAPPKPHEGFVLDPLLR